MLVDAIILNDELDLLLTRLALLDDHVDHFLVAESRQTFSGHTKPLHLSQNKHLFTAYVSRMTVVEYGAPAGATPWQRESLARDCLVTPLQAIAPDGIALLCDVDEFPSAEQCARAREVEEMVVVPLATYFRRANWRVEYETPLLVTRASPVGALPAELGAARWDRREEAPRLGGDPGCHLSYMGFAPEALTSKYQSFSHTELDFPAASSSRLLRLADVMAVDHLGRADWRGRGLLSVESPSQWGSVQRSLFELKPQWFDTRRERPPRIARRFSATLIDEVVTDRSVTAARLVGATPLWRGALDWAAWRVLARTLRQDGADLWTRVKGRLRGALGRARR